MKPLPLICCVFIASCSGEANHLGNPLLLPVYGIGTAIDNAAYAQRRGAVELIVKSNHPSLLAEIEAGGGMILDEAMDAAQIPAEDWAARTTQMQGDLPLYRNNPSALVVALMVYGG